MSSVLLDAINHWLAKEGRGPGTSWVGSCPAIISADHTVSHGGEPAVGVRLVVNMAPKVHMTDEIVAWLKAHGARWPNVSRVLYDEFNRVHAGVGQDGLTELVIDAHFPVDAPILAGLDPDGAAPTAPDILRSAAQAIDDRAKLRDCPDGERSMQRAVAAFNALHADGIRESHGHLTEVQGWQFMEILKHARSVAGGHHADDHVDRAAYAALAGEAAAAVDREEKEPF